MPPLCRETQSLGQQMLHWQLLLPMAINGLIFPRPPRRWQSPWMTAWRAVYPSLFCPRNYLLIVGPHCVCICWFLNQTIVKKYLYTMYYVEINISKCSIKSSKWMRRYSHRDVHKLSPQLCFFNRTLSVKKIWYKKSVPNLHNQICCIFSKFSKPITSSYASGKCIAFFFMAHS